MIIELKAETIDKDWQGTVMVGHARMDERRDEKVSRGLMAGIIVEKAGKDGKDVLIVRVSREGH